MINTFLFAANAVLPVIFMTSLGYLLKRIGLCDKAFAAAANRLCFRVLLPIMLFRNLYSGGGIQSGDWSIVLFAAVAIVLMFLVGMVIVRLFIHDPRQKGVVLQCVLRSNFAIIGLPLSQALAGDEGARMAAVVSVVAIPLFNTFASVALSMYLRDERTGKGAGVGAVAKKVITNPLIIGVLSALAVLGIERLTGGFGVGLTLGSIEPLYTAIDKVADISSPLALIALGVQFEFSAAGGLKKPIAVATVSRLVIVPALAIGAALLFFPEFGAEHYALLVALTASPVAVSSAIMASEMDNDGVLAGQLVVWTTFFSMISVFIIVVILRAAGVF